MAICKCGQKIAKKKETKKISIDLSNPGTVEFEAPTVQCDDCKETVFHEDDADEILDAFDEAYKKKKLQ